MFHQQKSSHVNQVSLTQIKEPRFVQVTFRTPGFYRNVTKPGNLSACKEASTSMTSMLLGSTMPLTVMAFRVQLAISSWLRCIGWQLVYWQCVIWLLVLPQSLACSRRPWAVGVPAVWSERARVLLYRLTEAESSQPTHCSCSPSSAYFEGPFVWSSKLVCQNDDSVWLEDFKMA